MTVTLFDGTDDSIQVSLGGCNLSGDLTIAVLAKRGANGVAHALVVNHDSGAAARAGLEYRSVNTLTYSIGGTGAFSTTTVQVADGWTLMVLTKTTGTTTPRYHILKQGAAWVHENADKTLGNPTTQAGGTVRFGEWAGIDDLNGLIAVAGEWTVALTDLQCEELANEGGWAGNTGGSPVGLWRFTTAPIVDLVGTATESARTGTVISTDDPVGFSDPQTSAFNAIPFMR